MFCLGVFRLSWVFIWWVFRVCVLWDCWCSLIIVVVRVRISMLLSSM